MNDEYTITFEQVLEDIRSKPIVPIWPHIGMIFGVSKNRAYHAAQRGEIETVKLGRQVRAVTAPLRRKLGIEDAAPTSSKDAA